MLGGLCCLFMGCFLGCQKQGDAEQREAPAGAVHERADTQAEAPRDEVAARAPLSEIGRHSLDGYLFDLSLDEGGNVLITTRRGRAAAYLLGPETAPDELPFAVDLPAFAAHSKALGGGLYGLSLTNRGEILVMQVQNGEQGPELRELWRWEVDGQPAAMTEAFGLLWVLVRNSESNRDVVAFDVNRGEFKVGYDVGDIPTSLLRVYHGDKELLLVSALNATLEDGELVAISTPGEAQEGLERVSLSGQPLELVTYRGVPSLLRRDQRELLSVELEPLAIGSPQSMAESANGVIEDGKGGIFAISSAGGVHHLDAAGESQRVATQAGLSQILRYGGQLITLNMRSQKVQLRGAASLEVEGERSLDGVPGRMVVDAKRHRLYLSLPEREELLILSLK